MREHVSDVCFLKRHLLYDVRNAKHTRATMAHFNSEEHSQPLNSSANGYEHTGAMVSHFTYSVADLSGVDKGTGTGSVRNAVGTLPC